MYSIENKANEFYRFNMVTGEYIKFRTIEDFYYDVYKVFDESRVKKGWKWKLIGNEYFLSLSGFDLIRSRIFKEQIDFSGSDKETDDTIYTKEYLYHDGLNRIIDIRKYKEESLKMFYDSYAVEKYENNALNKMRIEFRLKNARHSKTMYAEWRKDPVPYTGLSRCGCRGTNGGRRYMHTYRLATDPEYGDTIRNKSITKYAFSYNNFKNHESWKKNKKERQWM